MSRQIWDFPGGVHPPQNKAQSNHTPIAPGPIPDELILPLSQHMGLPATPLVEVGDKVLKGQMIAEPTGFISAAVHAPTSGVITAIEPRVVQHPSQLDGPCIVLKPDGEDRWTDHQGVADYRTCDVAFLQNIIRDAGITGMGGAGFPTSVKASIRPGTTIEQLIINAVECEPYITADDLLMRERAKEIIQGAEILGFMVSAEQILVGIEDNKPEAIAAMEEAARGSRVAIRVVPTKYPSGGEKQLIRLLTGKEVSSGGIPAQVGVVCQNTGTTYAVQQAIVEGKPLISRITTMTGDALATRGNFEVLLGTPVKTLLQHCGVMDQVLYRLVMGGPMMGFTMHSTEAPVVKTTNCIIAATQPELPEPPAEQPCIRCGSCAQVCPMSLLPQQLYWFSKNSLLDNAERYNLMDCIECGACSFVCPSNIPLVQYYRYAKGEIRVKAEEKIKSDHARERFEARQARLEKEQAEKEAKRRERAEKAAKAQAAKKAAAASATTATTSPEGTSDPITPLKSELAKATKKWKDAEKALKTAEANGADNLDKIRAKIEVLKNKAEEAKEALATAQAAAKAGSSSRGDQSTAANAANKPQETTNAKDDPLAELKEKSQKTFAAYQKAKEKLETAKAEGSDKVEALEMAVEKAKEKSDAAKKAMKEAREAERERIRAEKAASSEGPDIKQLKIDAAVANAAVKKAEKAINQAESDGQPTDQLQTALADAKVKAEQASKRLEEAEQI